MTNQPLKRFGESFSDLKQMFGGGQVGLHPHWGSLLLAGVEIPRPTARNPPSNLMSGGEKAVSSFALLFSIIRVKTIPFCYFDEAEAALCYTLNALDYLNRFDKDKGLSSLPP